MPLIDYSNVSNYSIDVYKNVTSLSDFMKTPDTLLGLEGVTGLMLLIIVYAVVLIKFSDYDFKVGFLISTTINLLLGMLLYMTGFINVYIFGLVTLLFITAIIMSFEYN